MAVTNRQISTCSMSPEKEKNSWISLSVARSERCPTCTVLVWKIFIRKNIYFLKSRHITSRKSDFRRIYESQRSSNSPAFYLQRTTGDWALCSRKVTKAYEILGRERKRDRNRTDVITQLTDKLWRWWWMALYFAFSPNLYIINNK